MSERNAPRRIPVHRTSRTRRILHIPSEDGNQTPLPQLSRPKEPNWAVLTKLCAHCGKEFHTINPGQEFCRPGCSKLFQAKKLTRDRWRKKMQARGAVLVKGLDDPIPAVKDQPLEERVLAVEKLLKPEFEPDLAPVPAFVQISRCPNCGNPLASAYGNDNGEYEWCGFCGEGEFL